VRSSEANEESRGFQDKLGLSPKTKTTPENCAFHPLD
jgi:hypothetical protein